MPVTWCYPLEDGRQYCSTGFPMGCYVRENGGSQDCVISVCTNCLCGMQQFVWIVFMVYLPFFTVKSLYVQVWL